MALPLQAGRVLSSLASLNDLIDVQLWRASTSKGRAKSHGIHRQKTSQSKRKGSRKATGKLMPKVAESDEVPE